MSDLVEEILNGDTCQYCGQVFIESGEGFPRTCSECTKEVNRPEQDYERKTDYLSE